MSEQLAIRGFDISCCDYLCPPNDFYELMHGIEIGIGNMAIPNCATNQQRNTNSVWQQRPRFEEINYQDESRHSNEFRIALSLIKQ